VALAQEVTSALANAESWSDALLQEMAEQNLRQVLTTVIGKRKGLAGVLSSDSPNRTRPWPLPTGPLAPLFNKPMSEIDLSITASVRQVVSWKHERSGLCRQSDCRRRFAC